MRLIDFLFRRPKEATMRMPPPRNPDPELPQATIQTTRKLTRADEQLERRRRLNLELDRAVDVIRSAGASDARSGR